jgi:hypothetical protein
MWHRIEIKGGTLIMDQDFDAIRFEITLKLDRGIGLVAVGMAHHVVDCFVRGQDHRMRQSLVKTSDRADCFNERTS